MLLRIGLLLAGSVLIGQAQSAPSSTVTTPKASLNSVGRLRSFQTGFPPDIWSISDPGNPGRDSTLKMLPISRLKASYCISRSLKTHSVVFIPCQPQNRVHFLSPFKMQQQKPAP